MPRFFRRIDEGEWDLEDFDARTAELADFVARAREAYDLAPPVALGFSNGANIAWSLMLRDPALLGGAILMRAMLPFDPRPLPDLDGIPVLILAGVNDPLVPVDQAGAPRRVARRGRRRRHLRGRARRPRIDRAMTFHSPAAGLPNTASVLRSQSFRTAPRTCHAHSRTPTSSRLSPISWA